MLGMRSCSTLKPSTYRQSAARAHDDVATLRRELVMYGFLERERGVYRVAERLPDFSRNVAQEL